MIPCCIVRKILFIYLSVYPIRIQNYAICFTSYPIFKHFKKKISRSRQIKLHPPRNQPSEQKLKTFLPTAPSVGKIQSGGVPEVGFLPLRSCGWDQEETVCLVLFEYPHQPIISSEATDVSACLLKGSSELWRRPQT